MNTTMERETSNNGIITISLTKDDAYRAKVAKQFRKDGFFSSVHIRANRLINEITDTMDRYVAAEQGNGVSQSMGNNIILFTAARGQGKTSAMNTFAAFLDGKVESNGLFEYEDSCYEENKFEVLGIIDPTMMNQSESIVRVFLSKLFIKFENIVRTEEREHKLDSESKLGQNRIELLKLFSRCYDNINFLESTDKNYMEQNDLDSLARLGSSTELRMNLRELVEKYRQYKNVKFLVLQIDDADLSAGNIFDICEQIREYLRIPGIIVLMAADSSQLRNSVFQEYLGQYKDLQSMQKRIDIVDTCYRKTWRYLEKMFPEGHRIFLPDMADVLRNDPTKVKLKYVKEDRETKIDLNENVCVNIQEQLIRLIYDRTGIVFMNSEDEMRSIFPETLRQLTHFIMEIGEMEPINHAELYQNYFWNSEGNRQVRENAIERLDTLNRNLDRLYNYYFHEWIYSRVSKAVFDLWFEINKKKGDSIEACRIVLKELREKVDTETGDLDFNRMNQADGLHVLMNLCKELEKGRKEYERLYDTLCVYYSIKMNKWFIDFVRGTRASRILEFSKNPVKFDAEDRTGEISPIYYHFSLDFEDAEPERHQIVAWEDVFLSKADGKSVKVNELGERSALGREFDVWNPVYNLLRIISNEGGANQVLTQIALPVEGKEISTAWDMMLGLRLLVTNVDIKRYVLSLMMEECKAASDRGAWRDKLKSIYSIFDKWHNDRFSFLEISNGFDGLCELTQENDPTSSLVFLSNKNNYTWYCVSYANNLKKKFGILKEFVNQIQVAISNGSTFSDDGIIYDREFYYSQAPSGYTRSRALDNRQDVSNLTEMESQMQEYYGELLDMIQKKEWIKEDVALLKQRIDSGNDVLAELLVNLTL